MAKLNKKDILIIILCSVCFIVGVLCCIIPQAMYNIMELVVCWILIIYGMGSILIYCLSPVIFENPVSRLSALESLILGFAIMVVNSFLVVAIAFLMLLIGIAKIVINLKNKDNERFSKIDLIVGCLFCVFGITIGILFYTTIALKLLMIILGAVLIVESVGNLLLLLYNKKNSVANN